MSLEQLDVVDAIGVDNDTDIVTLAIIDNLDWSNETEHLHLLQGKLNLYLGFIESGEIFESYPEAKGRNIEIKIYSNYEIPEVGLAFLNKVFEIISAAGFTLTYEISDRLT